MKERIIELLAYPRSLLSDQIDFELCPHSGRYDQNDGLCRKCGNAPECSWLVSNDEFVALKEKTLEELIDPLGYAVDFVNVQIAYWGHDPMSCDCDTCFWVRAATQVQEEARGGRV